MIELYKLSPIILILSGCAGLTTQTVALAPEPNKCQVTEARPTMFSTLTIGVCWGADGEIIGFTGIDGQPSITIPLAILGAGASVGNAVIKSTGIVRAARSIPNEIDMSIDAAVSPVDVDVGLDVNAELDVTGDVKIDD